MTPSGRPIRVVAASLALAATIQAAPPQAARGRRPPSVTYPYEVVVEDVIWGHLLEGEFSECGGIFFEPNARELYVTDVKNALIGIYDAQGVPLFAFGGFSQLVDPKIVAAAPDGTIHVLDTDASAIKSFNYRGEALEPTTFSLPADEPPLERIATFTIDAAGNWVVADADRPRVLAFDARRELRFSLPRPDDVGEFEVVRGLAVSADGLIAVLDYRATPVQVFDAEGRFVSGFGSREIGLQNFTAPQAAAFDEDGYLYVVDLLRHDVKIFDVKGDFQGVFGGWFRPETRGRSPGEMLYPTGIAVAPGGYVYVSERFGRRVQLFARERREDGSRLPPRAPAVPSEPR